MKKLIARAAVSALALVAALTCSGTAQAGTPAPQLKVIHYNLCGASYSCANNQGGTGAGTSVARLVGEAAAYRADVLTIDEICLSQYAALKAQLTQAGWTMDGTYASSQDNVVNCGSDKRFGSAVLSRQNVPDDIQEYHAFVNTGGETYTNDGRTVQVKRGMLCANTSFADRPLKACTAHTYAKEPRQLQEIAGWVADPALFPVNTPVVLGADLNLQPNEAALAHLYDHTHSGKDGSAQPTGRFLEADESNPAWFTQGSTGGVTCTAPGVVRCRNGAPTTSDARKIDYVFADRRHFTAPSLTTTAFAESDHAMLKASLGLIPARYVDGFTGDFNHDGHHDVLARTAQGGDLTYWAGDGTTTVGDSGLAAPTVLGNAWENYTDFATGDFDDDGRTDVVGRGVATGSLEFWAGEGTSGAAGAGDGLAAHTQVAADWQRFGDTVGGDFDGDGHDDLLARETATGKLFFWAGSGTTSATTSGFAAPVEVAGDWTDLGDLAAGDLDGNGTADLVARDTRTDQLRYWPGLGSAAPALFGTPELVGSGWGNFTDLAATDLNGDGRDDLVGRARATDELWFWAADGTIATTDGFAPRTLLLGSW
ncbi:MULTISPECIES: VCBS repeat-containing protein [unclassified Streptomyces]|uniref:FG-GAP repeat domain-containing protein n=1 Tax=unclassified Streptomyces TaxID=2593676 RepID=UPI00278C5B16|nr:MULTISPECIES: VCBS repeat-containing protein [unclassified Streptomyces]